MKHTRWLFIPVFSVAAACGGQEELHDDHQEDEDADDSALPDLLQILGPQIGDEELADLILDGLTTNEPDNGPEDPFEDPFEDPLEIEDGDPLTATTIAGLNSNAQRPHWGSSRHGDASCRASSHPWWSTKYGTFSVYKWSGCHATVYYKIEPSITRMGTRWVAAVDRAFRAWDRGDKCSPHWVNIRNAPSGARAKIQVEALGANGHCKSSSTWYACVRRDRAMSRSDQHWWLNLNTAQRLGIGVRGKLDVESLVATEIAHVLYFAHNPNYADSISTSSLGRWGNTYATLGQADVCRFNSYVATCANCGNRRALRAGDRALLNHLYANSPNGCTTAGRVVCGCNGLEGYSKRCQSNHKWSACRYTGCGG